MPATLTIEETGSSLSIRVRRGRTTPSLWNLLAFSAVSGICLWVWYTSALSSLLFLAFLAWIIISGLITYIRGTDVTLEVTDLDLVSTGHAPDGYGPASIPRAAVTRLQHRLGCNADEAQTPTGLYAEYQGMLFPAATCVLPGVDEAQANQTIATILRCFPDTERLAAPGKAKPSNLISLNLH